MKRLLIVGAVAVVALSVVAYAFASGGEDESDATSNDDLAQVDQTPPAGSVVVDLPLDTPAPGNNAAGGTRPVGSNEPFGPAGEPITKTPDAPVSSTPGTAPDRVPPQPSSPAPSGPAPTLPADRVAERAPIDGLSIRVAESFPPQYFLNIKAGLPSGCAQQYTHSIARTGDTITVTVLNSTAKDAMCTAIYGMYELNLNLGSGFDSGKTYTVKVNDKTTTFTAQ